MLIYFLIVLFICFLVVSVVLFPRFASGRNNLFFKTRPQITMGYIFTVVTISLLRVVETMGLLWAVDTMGLLRAESSMGYGSYHQWAFYRPHDRLAKHGPITDHIMAVNGLELESSIHGPTITGHR